MTVFDFSKIMSTIEHLNISSIYAINASHIVFSYFSMDFDALVKSLSFAYLDHRKRIFDLVVVCNYIPS